MSNVCLFVCFFQGIYLVANPLLQIDYITRIHIMIVFPAKLLFLIFFLRHYHQIPALRNFYKINFGLYVLNKIRCFRYFLLQISVLILFVQLHIDISLFIIECDFYVRCSITVYFCDSIFKISVVVIEISSTIIKILSQNRLILCIKCQIIFFLNLNFISLVTWLSNKGKIIFF